MGMDALESWEKATLGVIKFTPMPLYIHSLFIIITSVWSDLIDLLHDKDGIFSYIIVGRSMHGECCIYGI